MGEVRNNTVKNYGDQLPLYERPGRLNPDRHVPIERSDSVGVNVYYDDTRNGYLKDSDSPEFTDMSVNAMGPFEDSALLSGFTRAKSTGVKTGAQKLESKIFVPEINTEEIKKKIKKQIFIPEPEQPVYVADEDRAASTDYIADAMSGVETVEQSSASSLVSDDVSRLKTLILLIASVIVIEIAGIALLLFL